MDKRGGKLNVFQVMLIAAILLVVFAVVGFPMLTGHGGPAERTVCLSKGKQMGRAGLMYAADWDERLMDRDEWMDAVLPYHKNPAIEHCPAMRNDDPSASRLYGFAFNSLLSRKETRTYPDPMTVPMIYDSINLARNASDPFISFAQPGRHKGTGTIVFLDSHAKRFATAPKWP